jgi:hypothetical protein
MAHAIPACRRYPAQYAIQGYPHEMSARPDEIGLTQTADAPTVGAWGPPRCVDGTVGRGQAIHFFSCLLYAPAQQWTVNSTMDCVAARAAQAAKLAAKVEVGESLLRRA